MERRGLSDQTGQTAAEYFGLLLVVAAIIAAIGASGVAGTITREIGSAICSVSGGPCGSTAGGQPEGGDGATAQVGEERPPERSAEKRRRQQAVAEGTLRDDVRTQRVAADSSATRTGKRSGASLSEAKRGLARERLTGFPLPPFLTEQQQRDVISQRLFARHLRAIDPTPPTPMDPDGDGVEQLRPPPRPEDGNVGDRFAGELCGLAQGIPLIEDGACSLGDGDTAGFQQGRRLGETASVFLPTPAGKLKAAERGVEAVDRASEAHRGRQGLVAGTHPRLPGERVDHPRYREGTRQTRIERRSQSPPSRPARRPAGGRPGVIGPGDPNDLTRPGEQALELPSFNPDGGPPLDVRAQWKQNAGQLRELMAQRRPIRDAGPKALELDERLFDRAPIITTRNRWLNAERQVLERAGWVRRGDRWHPPGR